MFAKIGSPIITVIGDTIVDRYVIGAVSRISPEAPVPVLLHRENAFVPGGSANVAANAAAMGAKVRLVGLVGADGEAAALRKSLAQYPSLDAAGLVEDASRPTITKMRVLAGRQQLLRIDRETTIPPSPDRQKELIGRAKRSIQESGIVILSDYQKGVLSDAVIAEVIDAAERLGVPIIVDPKRADFGAYRGASLLKPNARELETATGLPVGTDQEVCLAAEAASAQSGGDVLVTRSELGMTLWRRETGGLHFPTEALEVADVSGAGDTSLAALAVWLANGHDLEEAVKIANKAAGIAVSRLGTTVVTRDDIERALWSEPPQIFNRGRVAPLSEALDIVAFWRRQGHSIVFTNGCFDLIHPGHINLLDQAAAQGGRLLVALNSDASVRRLKGPSRPVQDELARARVMGSIRMVDLVLIFEEDTPLGLIHAIKPDVLVKGADYSEDQVVGGDYVKSYGGKVALVPLVPDRSTSALVQRARAS
jgi:D-beta-D-heptose 7-phosphate kinase / D-beta-D-heptose 1-phosphate adenosyltransferase